MALFIEVVDRDDPGLLASVLESQSPSFEQRLQVRGILGNELSMNVDDDGLFNDRATQMYELIEQFVAQFPLDR